MGATGKRYSAGAIFLQVVPVFANIQEAIREETDNIDRALGDQMEKSGRKAGQRAGKAATQEITEEVKKASGAFEREFVSSIGVVEKALGGINTKKLSNDLRKEVADVKKELNSLKEIDLTVDVDRRKADVSLAELEGRLMALRDNVKIIFRTDIDNALKGFAKIEAAKDRIADPVDIEVRAETRFALREMSSFEKSFKKIADKAAGHLSGSVSREVKRVRAQLDELGKTEIGVDISANMARNALRKLKDDLDQISRESTDIDIKVDAGRAYSELAAFEAALEKIDGQDVEVDVKTDRSIAGLLGLTRSGEQSANMFRSFNIVLLAVAGAGPALIPVLAAIAGGLLALGPAAAVAVASLATVLIGFSGISGAFQALQAQQDSMATSTAQAAKTEASSARAIADARRAAAKAIEAALDQQRKARERYRDSVDDVREAEQALKEAREEAKNKGETLDRDSRSNALAIQEAQLDSFDATTNYNAVMADGSSTNAEREQARIDMEQAKIRLEELRAEQAQIAKDKKKWDKDGVEGTEEVQDAQENLKDAIDAQKDAYEAMGEAAKAVDEARAEGARNVAAALDAQAEAMGGLNAQQAAVDTAFSKLGESGQKFALFLFALRGDFKAFRDDVQDVLLPSIQEAIEGFMGSSAGGALRRALIDLAASFGRFAAALSVSFQGPAWTAFFEMLGRLGPQIQDAYGTAFIKFFEALASILTVTAPYAAQMAEGFAGLMTAFAGWAASKEGQDAIRNFMDWVVKYGPDVIDFLFALVKGAIALAIALAPWGDVVLKVLTGFLEIIAGMDPKLLAGIVTAIVVLITASQLAYSAAVLILSGGALIASSVALIIFAIVGILAAFAYLYTQNEEFRDFAQDAWKVIKEAIVSAWEDSIQPALEAMWEAIKILWKEVLAPFLRWLAPIFLWLAKTLIPLLAAAWTAQIRVMAWAIKNILVPGIKIIAEVFRWLWNKVLRPLWGNIKDGALALWSSLSDRFSDIGDAWDTVMRAMKWVWRNVLKPVWNYITDTALPALQTAFESTVEFIGNAWNGLRRLMAKPIKFLLETVINGGLIDGFNKVAKWVGADELSHIPIPKAIQQYATGGVMPGYTPGRDVHAFYSPTAGRLELSGGEAVMRPEWTQAMGPGYVNQMNALARQGGAQAIRKALGGYYLGGILPLAGASVSRHTSGYRGYAADLNVGSGADDYGMPVKAWKKGIVAQMNYVGDRSYGRWVVLNHGADQSSLYAHLSRFGNVGVGQSVGAGAYLGNVGDIGNSTSPHLHFEVNGGSVDYSDTSDKNRRKIPDWLMSVVKDPLAAVKGWVVNPLKQATEDMRDSSLFKTVSKVPLLLAKKTVDKVWDVIPGWVKTSAGWAGKAADWVVGGVSKAGDAAKDAANGAVNAAQDGAGAVADFLGFADGGILPYNGTMKYDDGGMLPPGLTSVLNLTGRPEPVFTADQWDDVGGGDGGTIHYEPHFEGSDLTAGDVAGDLNFQFRKIRRQGKYSGVGK